MKVLDLACQHGHGFEGWFGSEEDFQIQLTRGLVQCPICDNAKITKKLSAPRLNLRGAKEAAIDVADIKQDDTTNSVAPRADSMPASEPKGTEINPRAAHSEHPMHALMRNPEFQAAYLQMAKEVLAKTEDVGTDFAKEARKMHYGEAKARGIRGQSSRDETLELLEEGIEVMPLPLPKALKGSLH